MDTLIPGIVCSKIFGYKEEEILGKSVEILIPEKYKKAFREGLAKNGLITNYKLSYDNLELKALRKDRTEFPFDISSAHWDSGDDIFYSNYKGYI